MVAEVTTIRAGTAALFHVRRGRHIEIKTVTGKQVADFIAFKESDMTEYHSPTHTRSKIGRLRLKAGDSLLSNMRNTMFTLVRDDVGVHDLLFAACDPRRYSDDYAVTGHKNCRENFAELLRPYGIDYWRVPDTVNFFENCPVQPDGTFSIVEPAARPGDGVLLRAEMDTIILVSACPMDLNPCNGWRPSDLEVGVERSE